MKCPRCGNEWDASKGSCTNCGFVIRLAGQTMPPVTVNRNLNSPSKGNIPSGGLPNPQRPFAGNSTIKQQSGGIPTVDRQSGRISSPMPQTPSIRPGRASSPIPSRGSTLASNSSLSANPTIGKPAFEKSVLRRVSSARETENEYGEPPAQMGSSFADNQSFENAIHPPPLQESRPAGRISQNMYYPQTQLRPNSKSADALFLDELHAPSPSAIQQVSNVSSRALGSTTQVGGMRSLLPGVALRSGRYRLTELRERQEWLSGVFEATWSAQDAQHPGQQVMIREVVLPDVTSVMMQTMLRSATTTLALVGRHPHIPALWDAFSEYGRAFFVFEPIEGESLLARIRHSGRGLPEQDVIEFCLQMTEVLELLAQQQPPLVHGLIRPEHVIVGRNGSHYTLTNFSIILAGGATQFISGIDRSRLSVYTAPEFVRGLIDVRTDLYSLLATAYHAVTGSVPTVVNGSIPSAQRINGVVSSQFDAILSRGLRSMANQRYSRPSELLQDLLAIGSVNSTLVAETRSFISESGSAVLRNGPRPVTPGASQTIERERVPDSVAQVLPIMLAPSEDIEDKASLLPSPEELPLMKESNDRLNAAVWLSVIVLSLILLVVLSHVIA